MEKKKSAEERRSDHTPKHTRSSPYRIESYPSSEETCEAVKREARHIEREIRKYGGERRVVTQGEHCPLCGGEARMFPRTKESRKCFDCYIAFIPFFHSAVPILDDPEE